MKKNIFLATSLLALSLCSFIVKAQDTNNKERSREFYFSWGYNDESYTNSTIKINQPALGNNFAFEDVQGHDHRGWDQGIFNQAISIPQYNYRFGLIIDKKKDWGVEINFDHTKYIFADQQAHIKGTLNNRTVDTTVNFSGANGFYYYLNNGANFLLFNFVKRWHWLADKSGNIKIDFLGKAGIGPVIPHVQNGFFVNDSTSGYAHTALVQQSNDQHFQLGGWNIGIEGTVRIIFYKYVYLEYCNKLDYARYSNLKIYNGGNTSTTLQNDGTAKQAFGTYEEILNLGVTFPVGKR